MEKMFQKLKLGQIIGKEMTGKMSEKESLELEAWLNQSDKNRKLYETIKDEKELARLLIEFDEFDANSAWTSYQNEVSKQSRKRRISKFKLAASIILLVSLSSVLLLKYYSKEQDVSTPVVDLITPGEPKAFIQLQSGKKFDLKNLNETDEEFLAEEAGIVVSGNTILNSENDEGSSVEEFVSLVTPRGGEYRMILHDGTKVWLNADSKLEFPEKFLGDSRHVKLWGEAYFDVAKDAEHPFVVSLNGVDVKVLGTEFNISAYGNDDYIKTTLVEGAVSVINHSDEGFGKMTLSPGEQASFNKNNKTIEIGKVDVLLYTGWKDGRFIFDVQSLENITKILERWYDVQFVFINEELKNSSFSGEFLRYDNIDKIYEIIKKTGTQIEFTRKGRIIEIRN